MRRTRRGGVVDVRISARTPARRLYPLQRPASARARVAAGHCRLQRASLGKEGSMHHDTTRRLACDGLGLGNWASS